MTRGGSLNPNAEKRDVLALIAAVVGRLCLSETLTIPQLLQYLLGVGEAFLWHHVKVRGKQSAWMLLRQTHGMHGAIDTICQIRGHELER